MKTFRLDFNPITIIGILAAALLIYLMLSSCRRQPVYVTKVDTVKSTQTVYNTRDSLIIIPADSSWIKQAIGCFDENGKLTKDKAQLLSIIAYKDGQRVQVPLNTITNNVLTTECKVDTSAVIAKIKDRVISEYLSVHKQSTTIEYKTRGVVKVLAWIGGISIGLLVFVVAYFIFHNLSIKKILK